MTTRKTSATRTRTRSPSGDAPAELIHVDPRLLHEHPNNVRAHPAAQIAELRKSILQFGFTKPVLVDENNVILAGHGARLAAVELANEGILETIPAYVKRGLTEQQKRAYLLVDNRTGELSKWDKDKLLDELRDLGELDLGDYQVDDLFAKKETKPPNVTLGGDRFLLQIECADEKTLSALFDELQGRGLVCKILS